MFLPLSFRRHCARVRASAGLPGKAPPGNGPALEGLRRTPSRPQALLLGLVALVGCTLHHSKQALSPDTTTGTAPPADARFVTEEDSGLSIFGVFVLAEPDHYAVLLERLRRDHRCARLLYPQLDFYTDHWLLIAFPISRITSLCEPETAGGAATIPALEAPAAGEPAAAPSASTPQSPGPPPRAPAPDAPPPDAPPPGAPTPGAPPPTP